MNTYREGDCGHLWIYLYLQARKRTPAIVEFQLFSSHEQLNLLLC